MRRTPPHKAQRVEQPQEFYDQFDGAKEMVEIFGGVNLEKDGYEADDLIATFATRLSKLTAEVSILSSDRDLWQLISPHVHILLREGRQRNGAAGCGGHEGRDRVEPGPVGRFQGARGDASDNLKGVAGIGEKTATDLLQRFGTLERVLKAAHDPKSEMVRAFGPSSWLEKDAHDTRHLVGLCATRRWMKRPNRISGVTVDEEAVKEAFRKFILRARRTLEKRIFRQIRRQEVLHDSSEDGRGRRCPRLCPPRHPCRIGRS